MPRCMSIFEPWIQFGLSVSHNHSFSQQGTADIYTLHLSP